MNEIAIDEWAGENHICTQTIEEYACNREFSSLVRHFNKPFYFFFFTYSSWVFYRVCPKITFKFKRRVKNLSGFYVFSVDFCCFCFGSNERNLLLLFASTSLSMIFLLIKKCFVCAFVFFYYLFGRCHFHPPRSFSVCDVIHSNYQ